VQCAHRVLVRGAPIPTRVLYAAYGCGRVVGYGLIDVWEWVRVCGRVEQTETHYTHTLQSMLAHTTLLHSTQHETLSPLNEGVQLVAVLLANLPPCGLCANVYACTYVYVCVCIYIYMCVCVCMYICMYVCQGVNINICVYVCMYVCVYVYVCMCMCTYKFTNVYICVHICVQVRMNARVCVPVVWVCT
jgi:hypothetical protein